MLNRHLNLALLTFLFFGGALSAASGCGPGDDCTVTATCAVASGGAGTGAGTGTAQGGGTSSGGGGAGQGELGDPCDDGGACQSGSCADGVCCDEACDGVCEACSAAGACTPASLGTDPEVECGGGVCGGSSSCLNGEHIYSVRFGDTQDDELMSVVTDGSDNPLIAGTFEGALDLGTGVLVAGTGSAFIGVLDDLGGGTYAASHGSVVHQATATVAPNGDVVFVGTYAGGGIDLGGGTMPVGSFTDAFVGRFDSAGNHLWSNHFGTSSTVANRVLVDTDADGNVYLAVRMNGSYGDGGIGFGGPSYLGDGVYLAKLAANGNFLWSHGISDDSVSLAQLVVGVNGDVTIAGSFNGNVQFGGGLLASDGDQAGYVARYGASSGSNVFKTKLSGVGVDRVLGIANDAAAGVYVVGEFESSISIGNAGASQQSAGGLDAFVARLDAVGSEVWLEVYGDGADQGAEAIASMADGSFVVAGTLDGPIDFGAGAISGSSGDIFVAKFDDMGGHYWSRVVSSAQAPDSLHLTATSDGGVIAAGTFFGNLDWGGGPLSSMGSSDIFVARLAP
jgi:hypothetical protein